MIDNIIISGFADEICPDLDTQLQVVKQLGMDHICVRFADGKGVADFSVEEFRDSILPRLNAAGVGISSMGSPIGKVGIDDQEGYRKQLTQLETLCQICQISNTRYIRIFSFYIPKDSDPNAYTGQVLEKLSAFAAIAEKYDVVLIHENEKGIYGDTGPRCQRILEQLASPHFQAAFDFANFVQCGEDPALCWEQLKQYVSYIHIKDAVYSNNENVVCGAGDGKIAEILRKAIREDGYQGFLTLEPHLTLFSTFQSLETAPEAAAAHMNKAKNGAEGYAMQYRALCDILRNL